MDLAQYHIYVVGRSQACTQPDEVALIKDVELGAKLCRFIPHLSDLLALGEAKKKGLMKITECREEKDEKEIICSLKTLNQRFCVCFQRSSKFKSLIYWYRKLNLERGSKGTSGKGLFTAFDDFSQASLSTTDSITGVPTESISYSNRTVRILISIS